MEVGALMFPNPTGSADMARLIEGLGLQSLADYWLSPQRVFNTKHEDSTCSQGSQGPSKI